MKKYFVIPIVFYFVAVNLQAQTTDRISYNNQNLFLSGVNLAWMSFANDIGPGVTNYDAFADFFLAVHDSGGNAVRWWLHTNGSSSPAFDGNGYVTGPGEGTIQDLKTILDIAWEREVGVILCLWSFDMLRKSNSSTLLQRNTLLLTDTNYARAYINNCLIPMVDSLKGHPAIIAWEIFNEPEGMSNEFGWSDINHVPMANIQRFVNLCAGAIHRVDSNALVTNGTWSFKALTDVQISTSLQKVSAEQRRLYATHLIDRYHLTASVEEVSLYLEQLATLANYNYYADDRLIAAGGDIDGTLDFYSVHYYAGTGPSPFRNTATAWGLTKPIVVAEFHTTDTDGIPKAYLYPTLYSSGYAGALAWSWTDNYVSQKNDMLTAMAFMYRNYKTDVDVNGVSGDWPNVVITSPTNNAQLPTNSTITITVNAWDPDGQVAKVEFFVNDTVKIGEATSPPFSFEWSGMSDGNYSLKARVTDDHGNYRVSAKINIVVGTPPMVRYEAERAIRFGSGMSVKSSPAASGFAFVDMATNAAGTKISWIFTNLYGAGTYELAVGYNLYYDTPKGQYINVNGTRIGEIMFDGPTQIWQEKSFSAFLPAGTDTVELEASWGWMHIDYLAVPRYVVTSVENEAEMPLQFSLFQNFPNPFNPVTTIHYTLAQPTHARIEIYDVLGRRVATLVDELQTEGTHSVQWNGAGYASGLYVYRLQAGEFSHTKKMILMK